VTSVKEPSSENDNCGSSGFSKDPEDCDCSEESSLDESSLDEEPLKLIANTREGWSRCDHMI